MRRGSKTRPWTCSEVERLGALAGKATRREICRELRRSRMSVQKKAARLGLSLRVRKWRLVWCVECATWRTRLNASGRCRVCQLRANAEKEAARCADEYAAMTPQQRAAFDAQDARRGPVKRRPKVPSVGIDEQEHLERVEAWEAEWWQRVYDAEKSRLRRLRKANGTNPRKKSERVALSKENPDERMD